MFRIDKEVIRPIPELLGKGTRFWSSDGSLSTIYDFTFSPTRAVTNDTPSPF